MNKVYSGSETLSYFGNDHLGSRVLVYDSTGTVSNKFDYSAWGEVTQTYGSDASLISFTGKQLDASGLYYFNARYYDPITGRFVTEDPMFKGESLYVYCGNNPLNSVDPDGKENYNPVIGDLKKTNPGTGLYFLARVFLILFKGDQVNPPKDRPGYHIVLGRQETLPAFRDRIEMLTGVRPHIIRELPWKPTILNIEKFPYDKIDFYMRNSDRTDFNLEGITSKDTHDMVTGPLRPVDNAPLPGLNRPQFITLWELNQSANRLDLSEKTFFHQDRNMPINEKAGVYSTFAERGLKILDD